MDRNTLRGMEAVVILFVPMVAIAVYLMARFQSQGAKLSPQEETARLREQLAWHEQRLRNAKEKKWDASMIGQIADQLADTEYQLARVNAAQAASRRD